MLENKTDYRLVNERLSGTLKDRLKLDGQKSITHLIDGLYDAKVYHEQIGKSYQRLSQEEKSNYSIATNNQDKKREIQSIVNSVDKITKEFENIQSRLSLLPEAERDTLDSTFYEANSQNSEMMDLYNEYLVHNPHKTFDKEIRSGFEISLAEFKKTFLHLQKGLGFTRRDEAYEFVAGIEKLWEYFSKIYPELKPSGSENSKFLAYVEIWHRKVMKLEECDLKRHIKNARKYIEM